MELCELFNNKTKLTEFIETRSLYDIAYNEFLIAIHKSATYVKNNNATDSYWKGTVLDFIRNAANKTMESINENFTNHTVTMLVKVVKSSSIASGGAFSIYSDSTSAININIPASFFDNGADWFVNLIENGGDITFAKNAARVLTHEYIHLMQQLQITNNISATSEVPKFKRALKRIGSPKKMDKWNYDSLNHMKNNPTDYYTPDEQQDAKATLYLSGKDEVDAHALNSAQEMIDVFGSATNALTYLTPGRSKDLFKEMKNIPHLYQFLFYVGHKSATKSSKKLFFKRLYAHLKHYQDAEQQNNTPV